MQKQDIYIKKDAISSRNLGKELMLYDTNTDKVHILNETGILIWNLLDGKNDISNIEKTIKEKYKDTPAETISQDLSEIIEKLLSENIITKSN